MSHVLHVVHHGTPGLHGSVMGPILALMAPPMAPKLPDFVLYKSFQCIFLNLFGVQLKG
jgi:hypothetical protein